MNIDIPEVQALPQHAKFYRDGEQDLIEISFVGSNDTVRRRVKPEHMAQFRDEWNAYCDGTPMKQRPGIPLKDLPGIDDNQVQNYINRNVHNAEEIAALSDAQCQALGHGTITLRKAAREMLALKAMKAQERNRDIITEQSAKIGAVPAEKYASQSDIAEIKESIAALTGGITALVQALQPKPRGRPPVKKDEG